MARIEPLGYVIWITIGIVLIAFTDGSISLIGRIVYWAALTLTFGVPLYFLIAAPLHDLAN